MTTTATDHEAFAVAYADVCIRVAREKLGQQFDELLDPERHFPGLDPAVVRAKFIDTALTMIRWPDDVPDTAYVVDALAYYGVHALATMAAMDAGLIDLDGKVVE